MKLSKIQRISIKIMAIFSCGIAMSFIPELAPEFFGDAICEGGIRGYNNGTWTVEGCQYGDWGTHSSNNHWGYRHWLFFAMGVSLFIAQVVDMANTDYDN